jgi:hypothetical protein
MPGESTAAIRRATTNQGSQTNARWAWPRKADKSAESESDFNRGSLLLLRFIGRLTAYQQNHSTYNQTRQHNPPCHQRSRAVTATRRLRNRSRRKRSLRRRGAADSRRRRGNRRLRRQWRDGGKGRDRRLIRRPSTGTRQRQHGCQAHCQYCQGNQCQAARGKLSLPGKHRVHDGPSLRQN